MTQIFLTKIKDPKSISVMKRIALYSFVCLCLYVGQATAQIKEVLTLEQVVQLARDQSPSAILAKHEFRASFWEYRTHKAGLRPSVTLDMNFPQFNRSIIKYQNNDGSYSYIEDFANSTSAGLRMNQSIGFLGGELFAETKLQRTDEFGNNEETSYLSTPVSIGYQQSVLFFNTYKWEKKIEPLKYKEAQQRYIYAMENVAQRAVSYYFDLALAQQNLEVARLNYSNADTLYKIAKGRYQIGTIAENELMQMELSFLNAGSDLNSAQVDLEYRKFRLRSYLGFNEKVDVKLLLSKEIPQVDVKIETAMDYALANNPDIVNYELQLLEAERDVAQAKSEKGLQASLYASYGLTQRADEMPDVYKNPQDQQGFKIGLQMPILDWGLGRGRYKMAQSRREVTRANVQQSQTDFKQNIYLQVMQFNLQDDQLAIAAKADTIAQKRYDLTKQRFLIGKVDVLDLNVALQEKDQAKRSYIQELRTYWENFYTLRKITLFDFMKQEELAAEFDELVK